MTFSSREKLLIGCSEMSPITAFLVRAKYRKWITAALSGSSCCTISTISAFIAVSHSTVLMSFSLWNKEAILSRCKTWLMTSVGNDYLNILITFNIQYRRTDWMFSFKFISSQKCTPSAFLRNRVVELCCGFKTQLIVLVSQENLLQFSFSNI